MTRKEFIASYVLKRDLNNHYEAKTIDSAIRIADALEKSNQAPWMEKSSTEKSLDDFDFSGMLRYVAANLSSPQLVEPPKIVVGLINITPPGASISAVLKNAAAKISADGSLSPGYWELSFTLADPQGLILPGKPAKKMD